MPSAASTFAFLRVFVLPTLGLFALPLFGLWFSGHATGRLDREVLERVEERLARKTELSDAQRQELLEFYRTHPASAACADSGEELAAYRQALDGKCSRLAHFEWMRRLSLGALLCGLVAGLLALGCAGAAFVSRPLEYGGFVVGWNVLRVTGALQAFVQGGLAVWLSYWMTEVWLNTFIPKIIAVVVAGAVAAVSCVMRAIFLRPAMDFTVEAEALEESQAPEFWAHVRRLCEQLGTPPPDHLLVGIDANFFVIESPVRVGERTLEGRTLFVSLSLLRLLERSEVDAMLAHELGHLLGGDTGHSKRIAPMLVHFDHYLQTLHDDVLTRPIFHFMVAYRALFELSLGRSQRASEFAADRLAASLVSGRDLARLLVKLVAYANFRARVESELFSVDEQMRSFDIAQRVARGFARYASSESVQSDLYGTVTPHPFDSHPPLAARLENVGERLAPEDVAGVLLAPTSSSWTSAILEAELIEARLWGAYEARFAEKHDQSLAYRYVPSTDEERAHVEKHFPPLVFAGKKAGLEVRLDYAQLMCSEWKEPLPLEQVGKVSVGEELFRRKCLKLKLKDAGLFGGKRSINLGKMQEPDALVAVFNQYLTRHQLMEEYHSRTREAA